MKTETVKLSHFSVKEYLCSTQVEEDFRINERDSHSLIAQISVAYLLQFKSFEPLTRTALDSSPLAMYAAEHWIHHAKYSSIDMPDPYPVLKSILRLFTPGAAPFTNWVRIWDVDAKWMHQQLSMDSAKVPSPLYYASLAGIAEISQHLLDGWADTNLQGGTYGTALQAASCQGYDIIVNLLLEKGAEVMHMEVIMEMHFEQHHMEVMR